ncbi:hypothetical protein UCREL1_3663 [Eutypa lata UCREL1]|uniref:Uncharacterized protein n=1 Tax=Eutypa lata (strain UCR-EL1) TaxID=1287681 RepID=M7SXP6_EUTLA|nr:hypothetical protein UCREL1_3663 [Eutypa lata UCREL1]
MTRPKHQKRARDEEDEVVSKIKVPKSTKKTTKKAKTTAAASAARKAAEEANGTKYWATCISLGLDHFNALVKATPNISVELNEQGHKTAGIPSTKSAAARPSSSPSSSPSSKDGKKEKAAKPKKSNIEATSDEDENEH